MVSIFLFCNWKSVPFHHFHPVPSSLSAQLPTPTSGNHKTDLFFNEFEIILFGMCATWGFLRQEIFNFRK